MRKLVNTRTLIVQIIASLYCGSACAFVDADAADRSLQRYTVSLGSAKGACSGVVLAQDIVLTAAHCAGPNNEVQGIPVAETVLHPSHRPNAGAGPADLAILKLTKPLPHPFIPAVIDPRGLSTGTELIAAGYGGRSMIDDYSSGSALRMVLLRVIQTGEGWVALSSARLEVSGAGPGDSGSPVYTYRGLHSVVALISGGLKDHIIAVALAAHYRWIMATVQKLSVP